MPAAPLPTPDSSGVVVHTSNKKENGSCRVLTMKIIILGKAGIGKTALTRRYVDDEFTGTESTTIGAAFGAKRLLINGKSLVMGIWDTAGSERYEAMSRIYYRGARAAVVCYDISDDTSFRKVRFWVNELQNNETDCKIYLCGTKKDLIDVNSQARRVDIHDATDFADEFDAHLFETSSKTGENIDELFKKIAEDFVNGNRMTSETVLGSIKLEDTGRHVKRPCQC